MRVPSKDYVPHIPTLAKVLHGLDPSMPETYWQFVLQNFSPDNLMWFVSQTIMHVREILVDNEIDDVPPALLAEYRAVSFLYYRS